MRILSTLFVIFFGLTKGFAASEDTALREKIFKNAEQNGCVLVSRGGKQDLKEVTNKSFDDFVKKLVKDINANDATELIKAFHPRMKVVYKDVSRQMNSLVETYGKGSEVSLYRVWALNVPKGDPEPIVCAEDKLALGPHYGFETQFGIWLQVRGKNELARIYTTAVPFVDGWRLGAWFVQQWTFKGKDAEAWVTEALEDSSNKRKFPAYIKMDLAAKLLDGGGYVYPAFKMDVEKTRDTYFTADGFQKRIKELVKDFEIVGVGTIYGVDGPAVMIRMRVPKTYKSASIKPDCLKIGKIIVDESLPSKVGGVRCAYVNPDEDPSQPGVLGSRYVSLENIMQPTPTSKN